ncbi:MAG TPA: hypothetical protein VJL87_00430 [Bdellovibrionota bacterium]|nr:hypothetical protein [Bdellovibrionota bacterium]
MKEAGFSLIEMIITIIFLVIVLIPLSNMIQGSMTAGKDDHESVVAASLARNLVEEIQAQDFEDESANPWGNEETASTCNRSSFDDIDDYDIYQSWGGCTPPRDRSGNPIPGTTGFSENISVVNLIDLEDSPGNVRADYTPQPDGTTDSKQVTVTINWPRGSHRLTTIILRE